MIAFLLSTAVFSVLFALLLLVRPKGDDKLTQFLRVENVSSPDALAVVTYAALMIIPFIILCLVAGAVHPAYSDVAKLTTFVLSPYFVSAVIGAIFAPVFILWLYRLYRVKDGQAIPKIMYFEDGFLFILFIIGGFDVFSPYVDRLNSFKVAGTELSFAPISSRSTPSVAVALPPTTFAGVKSLSFGLFQLQHLGDIIERDESMIRLIDPDASMPPNDLSSLFKSTVSAIAECQSTSYELTGETSSARSEMLEMLPATRAYLNAIDFPGKVDASSPYVNTIHGAEKNLSNKISDLASRTFDGAINVEVVPFEAKRRSKLLDNSAQSGQVEARINSIKEHCLPLISFPCSFHGVEDVDFDITAKIMYCKKICYSFLSAQETCAPELGTISERENLTFKSWFRICFFDMISRALVGDMGHQVTRPYFPLMYASIAALVGEAESGNQVLEAWIARAGGSRVDAWYKYRVLSAMVSFTEEAQRSTVSSPAVVKQYIVKTYERVIASLEEANPLLQGGRQMFLSNRSVKELEDPPLDAEDSRECQITAEASPETDKRAKEKQMIAAAYSQITAKMNYIDRALDESDYLESYSPLASHYLNEMNAIDFSCLKELDGMSDGWEKVATIHHAEILRLNAKRILVETVDLSALMTRQQATTRLRSALAAAQAAKRLLSRWRNEAISTHENAPTYLRRIEASDEIETYNLVTGTLAAVSARLNEN